MNKAKKYSVIALTAFVMALNTPNSSAHDCPYQHGASSTFSHGSCYRIVSPTAVARVPEPSVIGLVVAGLLGIGLTRFLRR